MTSTAGDWIALPEELKQAKQWCIAGPDRAPYAVVGSQVIHASVHRPDTWKTFAEALADAQAIGGGAGVGFMLTYEDPWTCVDLDVVNEATQIAKGKPVDPQKWTPQKDLDRFKSILDVFDTYAEHSSGGWGIHIWARGRIGTGARRDGVEVYSQERFIVCTGKSVTTPPKPIEDRQELLDTLVFEIRRETNDVRTVLEEVDPEDSDEEVYNTACNASNGDKFKALCEGKWKDLGFTSQSEADLALMSMLAFYSKSNAQCRNLFRCTALGQREKAIKNDRYLNYTLEVIRGRQKREELVSEDARKAAESLVREIEGNRTADLAAATLASSNARLPEVDGTIDWPPGNAGAIAGFIYGSAPRPVKEVAIVGALGLLAGICGKAYTIHQSGLNVYIILVARSGVGKEAMHSGISLIMSALRERIPNAEKFVDFTEYVSGPALRKGVSVNPCFVNVAGEFGRRLKKMADDNKDGPASTLRTVMTDLYQKSGPGNLVGGLGYSDKEKNVSQMSGISYSMIGETTPGTFYEALTQSMMEDGFLSRFTVVDYTGDRPSENKFPQLSMDPALIQSLQGLCAQSMNLISRFAHTKVEFDPDAKALLDAFNLECDGEIRSSSDESYRQMWNRAHLKVLRFSSLLAVADNWHYPVVSKAHAEWALILIKRDIHIMNTRIQSGDVGADDDARERKMVAVLKEYLYEGPHSAAYGASDAMKKSGIVPKRFLQIRLSQISCFRNARNGATFNVDATIRSLSDLGYLAEVDKTALSEKYHFHGKAYRVVSLPPIKTRN